MHHSIHTKNPLYFYLYWHTHTRTAKACTLGLLRVLVGTADWPCLTNLPSSLPENQPIKRCKLHGRTGPVGEGMQGASELWVMAAATLNWKAAATNWPDKTGLHANTISLSDRCVCASPINWYAVYFSVSTQVNRARNSNLCFYMHYVFVLVFFPHFLYIIILTLWNHLSSVSLWDQKEEMKDEVGINKSY